MSKEFVSKDAAMQGILGDAPGQVFYSREDAADYILFMQNAQVEPIIYAHWEVSWSDKPGKEVAACSHCGATMDDHNQFWDCPRCPVCGAHMHKEEGKQK